MAVGLAAALVFERPTAADAAAWSGLLYAGAISMFVGSIAW